MSIWDLQAVFAVAGLMVLRLGAPVLGIFLLRQILNRVATTYT